MSKLRPSMSELADAIDRTASEGLCAWPSFDADDADRCLVMLADHLRSLLAAHDAETIARAQQEQMEADCKAACYGCNECWPILNIMRHQRPNGDGIGACESWRIRAAWAKAHPRPSVAKYRKKPVVVEAMQWDGTHAGFERILEWSNPDGPPWKVLRNGYALTVFTPEGHMSATGGDWIIKGVKGEFYPCKPEIFKATYEPLEEGE